MNSVHSDVPQKKTFEKISRTLIQGILLKSSKVIEELNISTTVTYLSHKHGGIKTFRKLNNKFSGLGKRRTLKYTTEILRDQKLSNSF